jgi:hypothetical protein
MKGIQVCSIKRPGPLQRGDNRKNGVGSFNILILKKYEARKAEFYMKAFCHRTKASWLKSWAPEGRMGEMKCILYFYISQGYWGERCGQWAFFVGEGSFFLLWVWGVWFFLLGGCFFVWFLAHLSWKLKWTFLITCCPASVCLSVCPSINFYIFDFFSRTTRPMLTKDGTNQPWVEGIQVCSNEGVNPSTRGDNSERVKIHWKFFKILFLQNQQTKLNQTSYKLSFDEVISSLFK